MDSFTGTSNLQIQHKKLGYETESISSPLPKGGDFLFNFRVLSGVEDVHPCIARLGAQYQSRVVCGSSVRCLALLSALKWVCTYLGGTCFA